MPACVVRADGVLQKPYPAGTTKLTEDYTLDLMAGKVGADPAGPLQRRSHAFLLFPIATITIAALITDERVTWGFLGGAAVALVGVWVGALTRSPEEPVEGDRVSLAAEGCSLPHPGCA